MTANATGAGTEEGRRLFFYFNGFNSGILDDFSGSAKIVAAHDFAVGQGYGFVPVSTCYREVEEVYESVLARIDGSVPEVVFCGSSMGGWFARVLQLTARQRWPGLSAACIAWNPAYNLAELAEVLLGPQQNFVTGERYEWTREHGEAMVRLERASGYPAAPPQDRSWYVYVDEDDEVIPLDGSREWHGERAIFTVFNGGCHSFDHAPESLEHFRVERASTS